MLCARMKMVSSCLLLIVVLVLLVEGNNGQDCKVDMVYVIDSSGSIRDNNPQDNSYDNWQLMLNFCKDVASAFNPGNDMTRIGAVTFGNEGYNEFFLKEQQSGVLFAINQIPYRGENTNTSGGIYAAMKSQFTENNGDRYNVPNVMVVITDGISTRDNQYTIPYAREAENMGIHVFGIGVTSLIDENEVKMISSYPRELNKNYFLIPNFDNLNEFIDRVKSTVCTETAQPTSPVPTQAVTTTTPGPCPDARPYGCWARQIMNRTLAEAAQRAALERSGQLNLKMNVAVVDVGANLVTFTRMDDAWLGSVDVAIKKAKTAVFFNMKTGSLGQNSQPGGSLYNIEHSNNGLITFPGGVPVYDRAGCLIGAVGVSGDTVENDDIVATAGVEAINV